MFKTFCAVGWLLFSSTLANSADLTEPKYDWSGFYVGVQGGYGWGTITDDIFFGSPAQAIDTLKPDGKFGGGHVAARWQQDWLTLGVEAEMNFSDISASETRMVDVINGATNVADVKSFGSINAEVGVPFERLLVSATVGMAFADIERDFSGILLGRVSSTDSDTATGWAAGAAIDYAVTKHFVIGARYRYYDFGGTDYPAISAPLNTLSATSWQTEIQTVALTATYRF